MELNCIHFKHKRMTSKGPSGNEFSLNSFFFLRHSVNTHFDMTGHFKCKNRTDMNPITIKKGKWYIHIESILLSKTSFDEVDGVHLFIVNRVLDTIDLNIFLP